LAQVFVVVLMNHSDVPYHGRTGIYLEADFRADLASNPGCGIFRDCQIRS